MGALAVLALLLLLSSGGSSTQQKPKSDPPPKKEPDPEPKDTTLDDLKKAADLVKTGLAIGVPIVAALGGGGAAAGGGGAAAGVGAGVTVHGGGGAAAAGGGGAASGAGAVGGGAGLTGAGAVGAGGIMLVLIIIVICNEISKGQAQAKSFQSLVRSMLPNARALHEFERFLTDTLLRGQVQAREERDWRLDRLDDGNKVVFQGWRTVKTWVPLPGSVSARQVRALAWIYLAERSWRGSALNRNWTKMKVPLWEVRPGERDSALSYCQVNSDIYPARVVDPAIGGLMKVPLIHGATVSIRGDKNAINPPTAELVARESDQTVTVNEPGLSATDIKVARLFGLLDAVLLFGSDPTVYVIFNADEYRDLMLMRLELSREEAQPTTWRLTEAQLTDPETGEKSGLEPVRHGFILPASVWGFQVRVDAALVKSSRAAGIEVM